MWYNESDVGRSLCDNLCEFALDTTDLVDNDPLARTDIHLKPFDTFNWQESTKAVFVQTFEELFDVFMSTT
ncbi:hypothetical protein DPMN_110789, partial [Dreissena polymorpha]